MSAVKHRVWIGFPTITNYQGGVINQFAILDQNGNKILDQNNNYILNQKA
jgi:hypothetical protein